MKMCTTNNYTIRFNRSFDSFMDPNKLDFYNSLHETASYVPGVFNIQFFFVILLNLLNVYILYSKRSNNRNNILSIFTAFADIAIVISLRLIIWLYQCHTQETEISTVCYVQNWLIGNQTDVVGVSTTTLSVLSNTATMSSTWGVLAISIDRLRAIRHPFKTLRKGIFKNVYVVITLIIAFTFISNVTRYWETKMIFNITPILENLRPHSMTVDHFKLGLNGIRIIIHIVIPLILLTITNTLLIFHLKNRSKYFEAGKWDRGKKSFDNSTGILSTSNEHCTSKIWSKQHASKEFKITIMMVLLISFHIISFFPTMLYHIYFEVTVPIMAYYFGINIDKMSYPIYCDDGKVITARKDLAYITITILVFGKIANSLLLCNLPMALYKTFLTMVGSKTSTASLTTRCENSNIRKISRVTESSRKVTRQENKSLIMPLSHFDKHSTYPC